MEAGGMFLLDFMRPSRGANPYYPDNWLPAQGARRIGLAGYLISSNQADSQ
jgi:hypothetical protein